MSAEGNIDDFGISFKKSKKKQTNKRTTDAALIEEMNFNTHPETKDESSNHQEPKRLKTGQDQSDTPSAAKTTKTMANSLSVDHSFMAKQINDSLSSTSDDLETSKDKTRSSDKFAPQQRNTTIRSTTVIDYQPDICKDYKETGTCGWGDTCKFIHDRGDFSNFTARKTWKEQMAEKDKAKGKLGSSTSNLNATKPSTSDPLDCNRCSLCSIQFYELVGDEYKNLSNVTPYMTLCKHYFCNTCHDQIQSKSQCPICKALTHQTFLFAEETIMKNLQSNKQQEQ